MSRYINLYAKRTSWAVYNTGGPYSGAYAVGHLNPSLYGGLSYKILDSLGNDLYIISTESFGRVAIYVPNDAEGLTWPYAFYTDSTYYGAVSNPAPSQPGNPVPTPGITGSYLNLHPHMQSWAIYNVGGPYVSNSKIGTLSPAAYGGLSYKILGSKGNDILVIQTESFEQVAIYAPVDADSSRTNNPSYHNYNSVIADQEDTIDYVETGSFLNLHPHMASWAVYNENGPYTTAHLVGRLSPQEFGGLSFKVLGNPVNDIYLIQTEDFGKVGIYAPRDEDSSFTSTPQYRDGNFGNPVPSGPGGTSTSPVVGNYLNLNPHMTSWGVYNPNGPYVSAHVIGYLAPSQYGGLSYAVIGKPATDVYLIQTESFGRVAIYAPADEDSSLTSTPRYGEGSTSIDSDISYIYDGIDLDGEGIVEIKPRSYWGASGVVSSGMSGTRSLDQLSHIVVHHTAGYGSSDESYMKAVQDYHQSLDWGDIGYHFAIGKSGVIMQGRSVYYVGAHAKQPMNTIALGVTLLGNFEYTMPTSDQVNSLVHLLSFLCNKYNISPSNIIGHRDVPGPAGSTTCPGNRFYNATNALSAIRNKVKSSQSSSLTKSQKDQQVKTFVQNKLDYTKYNDIMPSILGYGVETWTPYVPLSFNIRARQGVFYSYSPEVELFTDTYRTTRTKYSTVARQEVESIFDQLLQDKLGKSLSGVEIFDLFSILEPVKNSSNTGLGSSIEYDIDLPKRELTLRFITSYSVTLTDGSSVASALVTEIVFSGMGPLYAPVGSTEPVSSVEPIKQDFEVVKTVGKVLAIGVVVLVALAIGPVVLGAAISSKAVQATVIGTALLLVE